MLHQKNSLQLSYHVAANTFSCAECAEKSKWMMDQEEYQWVSKWVDTKVTFSVSNLLPGHLVIIACLWIADVPSGAIVVRGTRSLYTCKQLLTNFDVWMNLVWCDLIWFDLIWFDWIESCRYALLRQSQLRQRNVRMEPEGPQGNQSKSFWDRFPLELTESVMLMSN